MLLVYVMLFNVLMWDSGIMLMCVIEYGVYLFVLVCYSGELECGIVVVNYLYKCGCWLGVDVFYLLC